MPTGVIAQSMRDNDFAGAIISPEDRTNIDAAGYGLDPTGRPYDDKVKAVRTPLVLNMSASNGQRHRAARAGTGILIATHAVTAPTSGFLIVRLWMETDISARSLQYTVYHPLGQKIHEQPVQIPVLAGSWWDCDVQTANGAATVSASFTVNVG